MFQRFLLRLMGLEQQPPEPFEGDFGGTAYHVEALPKGDVSIWIILPRSQIEVEPLLRTRSDEHVPRTTIDHFVQSILQLGARSVDIGLSGNKIEAVVPARIKKVDRQLAEQVAALMVQIRYEALGARQPCSMPRPWVKAAEGTLDLGGRNVKFEFSSCVVHTQDDLAGNLDVMLRTDPPLLEDQLVEQLRLALPGFDERVASDGYGLFDDGDGIVGVSFGLANSEIGFNDEICEAIQSIRDVEMYWGNGPTGKLAVVPCGCAGER